jgi:LmbE family N-acetylglucosaminyl deacetylase
MGVVVIYAPHPDDETLSMGLAIVHYLAAGWDVHLVSMTRGEAGGPLGSYNGTNACNWANHPYTHDPIQEGYATNGPLTNTDLGAARLLEARSALGAMATVTPNSGVAATGRVYHHEGGLADGFGTNSPTAVADAQAVISNFVTTFPNAYHRTMSPTDNHPDHAACGQALRNLKNVNPDLAGAMFFVSRLYWDYAQNPDVAAQPGLAWFPTTSRKSTFDSVLRTRVVPCFSQWSPAAGSYAIGYHQVAQQFANNYASNVTIACLWHA